MTMPKTYLTCILCDKDVDNPLSEICRKCAHRSPDRLAVARDDTGRKVYAVNNESHVHPAYAGNGWDIEPGPEYVESDDFD